MNVPETRYAKTADGVHVAYQVFGDGSTDLVFTPGSVGHVEIYWENPRLGRFLRRLASFAAAGLDEERMRAWTVIRGSYLRPYEAEVLAALV